MTVTGSSIAIHPWANGVRVYAVKNIRTAMIVVAAVVIADLVEPSSLSADEEVSICHEDKDTHLQATFIKIATSIEIIAPADAIKSASTRLMRMKSSLN